MPQVQRHRVFSFFGGNRNYHTHVVKRRRRTEISWIFIFFVINTTKTVLCGKSSSTRTDCCYWELNWMSLISQNYRKLCNDRKAAFHFPSYDSWFLVFELRRFSCSKRIYSNLFISIINLMWIFSSMLWFMFPTDTTTTNIRVMRTFFYCWLVMRPWLKFLSASSHHHVAICPKNK